ncbi:hypothetical protein SNEBB_009442 [Seison nebaliae]|nr:hypothetical protein SNEBB_009442 [Seison nebaliae]
MISSYFYLFPFFLFITFTSEKYVRAAEKNEKEDLEFLYLPKNGSVFLPIMDRQEFVCGTIDPGQRHYVAWFSHIPSIGQKKFVPSSRKSAKYIHTFNVTMEVDPNHPVVDKPKRKDRGHKRNGSVNRRSSVLYVITLLSSYMIFVWL